MDQGLQGGQAQTGTRDETYDVIAVVYHALQGAENCQTYLQDASGDEDLRSFFQQAQQIQRQLADQGKQLLQQRLQNEGGQGQGSAFGFGQQQGGMSGQSSQIDEPSLAGQSSGGSGGYGGAGTGGGGSF